MAKIRKSMVSETSSTSGTGNFVVTGARNPGRTFTSVAATSDTFRYRAYHSVNNEWELGLGTMVNSTTISRSPVESSNSNSLVNFSSGGLIIDLVVDAAEFDTMDAVASDTIVGRSELATLAEALTGTDPARVITALVLAGTAVRSVQVQVFTANGTYTPTSGMKFCIVIGTGGGAGGGGADTTAAANCAVAGGGSSGATCIERFTAADIGASQAVTIGAAGTAGSNTGGNGGTGGNTTLGSLFTATGGVAGPGSGTAAARRTQTVAGAAGPTASGGLINIAGGDGDNGWCFVTLDATDTQENAAGCGGHGGASFWGDGGRGGQTFQDAANADSTAGSEAGQAGKAPGSGGGGGVVLNTATGVTGGVGLAGIMMIIEFI